MRLFYKLILVSLVSTASMAFGKDVACLFKNTNFQGPHFCFYPGQRPTNLNQFPLSDGSASDGNFGSIEIVGASTISIYDGLNYQSNVQPLLIDSSVSDLSTIWTTVINSIDVESPQPQQ